MSNTNRLDIIIFGASGFTGKRTISELSQIIKSENLSLTWGIAGRSEKKLKDTLLEIENRSGEDYSDIPIKYADVNDVKSLEDMTANARVVINAVGPYQLYGENVIQACIKTKTHQIDVSSPTVELQYIEHIYNKYQNAARENGIYIISACGIDAIPAELGTIFLQNSLEEKLNSVKACLYVTEEKYCPGAVAHAASYESFVHRFANTNDILVPGSKLFTKNTLKDLMTLNKLTNKWCFLSPCDTFSSKSQQQMCEIYNHKPILVKNYIGFDTFFQFIFIILTSVLLVFISKFINIKNILLKHPRCFSLGFASFEGPSEQKLKNADFHVLLVGSADELASRPSNKATVAHVIGRDYYRACGTLLAMASIIILTERDNMPTSGGCYAPAAAFANTTMIKMLSKHGIEFQLNPK